MTSPSLHNMNARGRKVQEDDEYVYRSDGGRDGVSVSGSKIVWVGMSAGDGGRGRKL